MSGKLDGGFDEVHGNLVAERVDGDVSIILDADVEEDVPLVGEHLEAYAVEVHVRRPLILCGAIFEVQRAHSGSLLSASPICHRSAL